MKIVTNATGHTIYTGKAILLPGTNTLPDTADLSRLGAFIARGAVTIRNPDEMTTAEKAAALKSANTEAELDKAEAALGATDEARREEIAAEVKAVKKAKRAKKQAE